MRRLLIPCLMVTACAAPALTTPPASPPEVFLPGEQPAVLPHGLSTPSPSPLPVPGLIRAPWNGMRKPPVNTPVLNYSVTWKGELNVTQLALAGSSLYALDRRLYAVPLKGGSWTSVDDGSGPEKTRMVSDGQRIYMGTQSGSIVGYDAISKQTWQVGAVPMAVSGLQLGAGGLVIGTERGGIYQIPLAGGTAKILAPAASLGAVSDLKLVGQEAFALGERVWHVANASCQEVPGSEGATALTSDRTFAYLGTGDGWLLRIPKSGPAQPLAHVTESPIECLGTDGNWLYASSGNTTYMLDLKRFTASLCHPGFPATVSNLTVQDGETVLVGTRKGLYSMPR